MGLTRLGDDMRFDPCFPKDWPQVDMRPTLGLAPGTVTILNPGQVGKGVRTARLNRESLPVYRGALVVPIARLQGALTLEMETARPAAE